MASEAKMSKADKVKPYFDRLHEHMRSKGFPNQVEIASALDEFKDINAKKLKYYERVDGEGLDPKIVPFGKYKGKTVETLISTDRPYLEWLIKQKWMDKFQGLRGVLTANGIGQRVEAEPVVDELTTLRAKLQALQKS